MAGGTEVHCLLRPRPQPDDWLRQLGCKELPGDITDPESLSGKLHNFDLVYHLAGVTKALSAREFELANATGTRNLLEAASQGSPHLQKFVLVSSLAAAGPSATGVPLTESDSPRPVSNYGKSKLLGEESCLKFMKHLPITIVRPPAVYGPRDTDVLTYFRFARRGYRPVLGRVQRTASFIFVKDLVDGIVLAAESTAAAGRTYYLSDKRVYTWDELGLTIAEVLGVSTRKITLPLWAAFLAAAGADLTARITRKASIINLDKFEELKMLHWVCSSARAAEELAFKTAYSLQQGLAETAEWYKQAGWL